MSCFVQILCIEDGRATVAIAEEQWTGGTGGDNHDNLIDLPLTLLPENSRAGDILQLQVSFCPYKTLSALNKE